MTKPETRDCPSGASPWQTVWDNLTNATIPGWEQVPNAFLSSLLPVSVGDVGHQLLKTVNAWILFQQASFQYQGIQTQVWTQTLDKLWPELWQLAIAAQSNREENWRSLLQIWSCLFDETFAQTFRSKDAQHIQKQFLHTALEYRLQQQQLAELILESYGLPTRREVDEIHRSIYELRKMVKSLKQNAEVEKGS
jgi:class III poly(R)-hydroxyalkanoic acid synthase PhaE subunit